MTMVPEPPAFVDTNLLVYADLAYSPLHEAALASLQARGVELWISHQILREYLATMTRPGTLTIPLPIGSIITFARRHAKQFRIAAGGPSVTARLFTLLEQFPAAGKQVHDANIVATMLTHGIPRLITHNTGDFRRYSSLVTVLPLT